MNATFPAQVLLTKLTARIHATGGEPAISEVVEELREHWAELVPQWLDRASPNGFQRLGLALLNVAKAMDRPDLACNTIRLRNEFATYATNDFDINVGSKIARSILEALANGDCPQVSEVALAIAEQKGIPTAFDDAFLANLIVADICLENGDFDTAIDALRKNLKASTCPTSQYLLYRALKAKSDAGQPVRSTEIFIDDLSDRFCSRPFDTLSTGANGRRAGSKPQLHACICPTSVPYPINGDSILAAWNGPEAQEIRRSILDGDFTYCSRLTCEQINGGLLPRRDEITDPWLRDIIANRKTVVDRKPTVLSLGHDLSCNIACPSCRTELNTIKNKEREIFERFNINELLPLMEGEQMSVILCNDGDPFYSKSYRNLLEGLDPHRHQGVRIAFLSNGLLCTPKTWDSLSHIHAQISHVGVSMDAAERDTYEDLRRPGKWETIVANMDFLSSLRRTGKLGSLSLQFVVQAKNYRQMPQFVRLGKEWAVDKIMFIRLFNSGSFSGAAFGENDLADPQHPEYANFLDVLNDPILEDPIVDLFTITPIHEEEHTRNARTPAERVA